MGAGGTWSGALGRKPLAVIIESLGLAVLLVTTFSQSLDGGAAGLPYFILLIVEGMGVMAWGALRRLKAPFFIGLGANAINVLAQLVLLFAGPSTLIRWLIIGGTGLFIVATAVFVERQPLGSLSSETSSQTDESRSACAMGRNAKGSSRRKPDTVV